MKGTNKLLLCPLALIEILNYNKNDFLSEDANVNIISIEFDSREGYYILLLEDNNKLG
jgi:hypothetical protein